MSEDKEKDELKSKLRKELLKALKLARKSLQDVSDKFSLDNIVVHSYSLSSFQLLNHAITHLENEEYEFNKKIDEDNRIQLLINQYVVKYYDDIPDATYKKVWEELDKEGIKHTEEIDESIRESFQEYGRGLI